MRLGLALDGGGGVVAAPGRGALGAEAPGGGAYGGGEEYPGGYAGDTT